MAAIFSQYQPSITRVAWPGVKIAMQHQRHLIDQHVADHPAADSGGAPDAANAATPT